MRKKNRTSSLQDEVEHILKRTIQLCQKSPETEFVHILTWKDDNLVFKKTERTFTHYVKKLCILLDENSTYVFHVQRKSSKLAEHTCIVNRLRHFTSSSVMIKYYNASMKPIIQWRLLTIGCTRKSVLNDTFLVQKKIAVICFSKLKIAFRWKVWKKANHEWFRPLRFRTIEVRRAYMYRKPTA